MPCVLDAVFIVVEAVVDNAGMRNVLKGVIVVVGVVVVLDVVVAVVVDVLDVVVQVHSSHSTGQ